MNEEIALLIIDMQVDFCHRDSPMYVNGASQDVRNLIIWINRHQHRIGKIFVSLDTHQPQQIFFPSWWMSDKGNMPPDFTVITREKIAHGEWSPVYEPGRSKYYVDMLEEQGKNNLVIWPYHCLLGTRGHMLDTNLYAAIRAHAMVMRSPTKFVIKGMMEMSEFYSIFEPEVKSSRELNDLFNHNLLDQLNAFESIYIAGEAKSHCVLESIQSMVKHAGLPEVVGKIHLLEDATSVVSAPGIDYETPTNEAITKLIDRGMTLTSTIEEV